MPLTPEEQDELNAINAELANLDDEEQGQRAVAAVDTGRAAGREPEPSSPFSLYRFAVGSLRDYAQSAEDTVTELQGVNRTILGDDGGFSLRGIAADALTTTPVGLASAAAGGLAGVNPATTPHFTLPHLEGEERAGTAEKVARSIGSFLIPFGAGLRALRGIGAAGIVGRTAQGLAAGAIADFSQVDPVGGNLANILKDDFGLNNAAVNALAAEQDDTVIEARFKAAASGAVAGIAADALFGAGGRLARAYRDWRGTAEEAKAIVDNLKKGPVKIEPLPANRSLIAIDEGRGGARAGEEIPTVEASAVYDPTTHPIAMTERQPQDFEDVLDFLREKAGNPAADPEFASRLAKNLLDGDPENALAKIGIDPAKLDYSVYTNPERLGRLQAGMAEIFGDIARGLGRTGERVTARAIARGAEALASDPDILKTLYGSTSRLAENVMAARIFVGGHAHQLLAAADAATKEIENGGAGPAWGAFLEAFHRHAYFLGALRGAGTEVGRALRSLQMLAKASPKQGAALLEEAVAQEAKAQAPKLTRFSVEEGASAFADTLTTDAEKLAALHKLVELRGDVAELSRTVREGNGSVWRRMNLALRETMGSLFGTATAVYNVGAGVTFLGLNGLGRLMAALVRTPFMIVGGEAHAQGVRAWLETWAYTEGVLGGFREAFRNTVAVLEHEGYSELAINADGLGFHDLAREWAFKGNREIDEATGRFERADVVNNKAFALTTAENRRLREYAQSLGGPQFFQAGLKAFVTLMSGSINAAGTAYRAGTTVFINLPDEFVGTLATRAGAYSQAVRIATSEAAELGLEGQQLGQYLKARTIQLFGDGPSGWSANGFDAGAQQAMFRAGETEAKAVLFQDDLELALNRAIARGVASTGGLGSLIIPFIKTPLRIIERTAIDYTPLGLIKDRIRWGLAAGGPMRDEALARMSLGMSAVMLAYQLAEDRTIVGYDGGFLSSARDAGRPSYSLKIGDDAYEFSRLDPIGTLLGMGADLRAYLDGNEDDPDAPNGAREMFEGFLWATAANVLSKSWLTSIRQLTDLAGATSPEDASSRWDNFLRGLATRAIPGSGIQRQLEAWGDDQVRQSVMFSDGLLRASIGADQLPVKRDIVGRPLQAEGMTRLAGIRGGVLPGPDDALGQELERLSFRKPMAQRTQKGVKLTAAQFSRFLEIRGHEVRDQHTGLTLEEALNQLVRMPEYRALPDRAKVQEIRSAMDGYSAQAVDKLTDEDHAFVLARLRAEVFADVTIPNDQREAALREFADKLGIAHN